MTSDVGDGVVEENGTQRRGVDLSRWLNDPRWRLGLLIAAVVIVVGIVLAVRYPLEEDEEPTPSPAAAVPTTTISRDVPSPAECQVAPRPLAALRDLAGTPMAAAGSPVAAATPATPQAEVGPADPATIAEINATYRESVACANGGDFARTAALFSDNYLRRTLAETAVSPELLGSILATPRTVPQERWTGIRAIGDVQLREDGRVTALVVTDAPGQPTAAGGLPQIVFFVQQDGRWLIDDVVGIMGSGTPVA